MKLDLKLLSIRFFQAEDEPLVPEGGVNRYLLDQVLRPAMEGETLYIRDVDFSAFDMDDIETLAEYHDRMGFEQRKLGQFVLPVAHTEPTPVRVRSFC